MFKSRKHIYHIAPAHSIEHDINEDCHYIIISSGDRYDTLSVRENVCVLHFADTEIATMPDAFSTSDIRIIMAFLDTCNNSDSDVFISCDEGRSRSPAVAAGLLRCSDQNDDYIWKSREYRPNVYVYSLMLRSCCSGEDIEEELNMLKSVTAEDYRTYRRTAEKKETQ